MSLAATISLLAWDLEIMDSNVENSLPTNGSKVMYIYPLQTPSGQSVVHRDALLIVFKIVHAETPFTFLSILD